MADIERADLARRDIDDIVKIVRKEGQTIDARTALDLLVLKLTHGSGYYLWNHLDGGWFVRLPRTDRHDEPWLQKVVAEVIHICKPVQFLSAVERQAPKEETAQSVGYARESTSAGHAIVCSRCNQDCDEQTAKKGKVMTKLHILGQKL